MHKISKIQLQNKNKSRANVYIDDVYSFSCDAEIILKYKLKEGLDVDKKNLVELIEESNEKRAFQIALHYLSFKPRTHYEITMYLFKKDYEDKIINKVLEKLTYYRYIDDKQYALNYISSAIAEGKKSSNTVKSKLISKGISLEIIEDCIKLFSSDVNIKIAKEISNKYFYQKSNLPLKQLKSKLSQLLVHKGFTWEVIDACLNDLDQNSEVQSTIDSNKDQYQLQAIKLAKKYFDKYSKKENNSYLLEKKVKHTLYQKGYDIDIIDVAFESIKSNR